MTDQTEKVSFCVSLRYSFNAVLRALMLLDIGSVLVKCWFWGIFAAGCKFLTNQLFWKFEALWNSSDHFQYILGQLKFRTAYRLAFFYLKQKSLFSECRQSQFQAKSLIRKGLYFSLINDNFNCFFANFTYNI